MRQRPAVGSELDAVRVAKVWRYGLSNSFDTHIATTNDNVLRLEHNISTIKRYFGQASGRPGVPELVMTSAGLPAGALGLFDAETQICLTHSLLAVGDLNREGVVTRGEFGAVGGDALGGDAGFVANALGDVDPHPAIENFQAVWIDLGSRFGNEANGNVDGILEIPALGLIDHDAGGFGGSRPPKGISLQRTSILRRFLGGNEFEGMTGAL